MRTHRSDLERSESLSRRLATLGEELSGVRPARATAVPADVTQAPWWDDHTRPAPPRHPPPAPLPAARQPAHQPVTTTPGRHAARPVRLGLVGLGPAQLAVIAVVVAAGLAVTCWWLVRGTPHPAPEVAAVPDPGLVSAAPAGAPLPSPGAPVKTAAATPATVTVDVAGKVRRPGIAVLDAGARVVDALEAAGGARPGADLSGLNLARVLVDGEQVQVGVQTPAGPAAALPPPSGAPPGPPALVNLNTASEAELDTLPDVGPVTAQSILAWRIEHGGFTSIEELLEVDGIGEVTLGRLAPYVTV